MNLRFDAEHHVYYINDIMVPGVTSVTGCLPKPWAMAWVAKETAASFKKEVTELMELGKGFMVYELDDIEKCAKGAYKRKSDSAATKGTDAHSFFEQYVKASIEGKSKDSIVMPTDPETRNSCELFLRWEMQSDIKWLESEVIVGHEGLGYGGKFDAIASVSGVPTLIDFKTSSGIYPEQYVQLAGYQMALQAMRGQSNINIGQRMILWVPKKGTKFEARIVPSPLSEDEVCFVSALNIYRWLNRV